MQRARRFKWLLPLLAFGLVTGGVVAGATPAFAASTLCSGFTSCETSTGTTDHGWASYYTNSYWGQYSGDNCTNYVAWYEQTINGQSATRPSWLLTGHDAKDWASEASGAGITVSSTPVVGAIAQWNAYNFNGQAGHVGIVEGVSSDGKTIRVSWDSYNVGPYKWVSLNSTDVNDGGSNHNSVGWPNNFIYLGVSGTSGGGSPTGSRLSAVSMPSGQQMIFWKGGDGKLDAAYWNGSTWAYQGIGSAFGFGQLYSPPGAVYQPSTGWIQVFWEGPGHTLYQAILDTNTGSWVGGWNLGVGSSVYSQPTAAVNGSQVDVYWTDSGGGLEEAVWNGAAWVPFDLGSNFWNIASAPTVSDKSSGENDVFWTDTAGNLDEGVWNGAIWVGFNIPVGLISSQPATTLEPSTGFQDVFWDSSGSLKETVYNGAVWETFTIPGATTLATAPTATAWGTQTDVYWTDSGGNLQEAVWNGAAWAEFSIPGMGSIPAS